MSFTLRSLLLAFVVIASALGTFGAWGLLLGVCIVGILVFLQALPGEGCGCLAVLLPLAAGFLFLMSSVMQPLASSLRATSMNNLKQISLALQSYEQTYGTLPPAYVAGPDGQPWHSWRVLILPFLERPDIYRRYDFNEPWNGPKNSKLEVPFSLYVNPAFRSRNQPKPVTSYFAVTGPNTVWPGAESRRTSDIPDGAGKTILLVETGDSGISWMEPRDLDYDEIVRNGFRAGGEQAIPHPNSPGFPFVCEGGTVMVGMVDGSVQRLDWGVPGDALRPLLTVDGGEEFDFTPLAPVRRPRRLNWPPVLSFATLILASLLLWVSTPASRPKE